MPELLKVEQALELVLEHARPLPTEVVQLAHVRGRILREPAQAVVDLPPFPSSAMDGFAVRAAETPGELPIAFRVAAGTRLPGRYQSVRPQASRPAARFRMEPTRSSRSRWSRIAAIV